MELKGSIRVLCRVRPHLEKERFNMGPGGEAAAPVRCLDEETVLVLSEKSGEKEYEFDRAFNPADEQEVVCAGGSRGGRARASC